LKSESAEINRRKATEFENDDDEDDDDDGFVVNSRYCDCRSLSYSPSFSSDGGDSFQAECQQLGKNIILVFFLKKIEKMIKTSRSWKLK